MLNQRFLLYMNNVDNEDNVDNVNNVDMLNQGFLL